MTRAARSIADIFAAARQGGEAVTEWPGDFPATLDAAYAIQNHIIAKLGRPISGWKVGRINAPDDTRFGLNRIAGPVLDDGLYQDGAKVPVFAGGFAAVEAELMIRMQPTATPDDSLDTLFDKIVAVHIGLEVASSPFPGINDNGPTVTAAEMGNNKALVIGAAIEPTAWAKSFDWTVTTQIDGTTVGQNSARALPDGPLGAVKFLLGHLAARGRSLSADQWVSTGAITGVHRVTPGQHAIAQFGDFGRVGCTIARA